MGFNVVGYGCTACVENSGPLDPNIQDAVVKGNLIVSSVLSQQEELRRTDQQLH